MKTVAEIEAFWSALPGASFFRNTFTDGIAAVEVADADARTAETAALQARARHRRAVAALRSQVEQDAAADWTPEDIEAARRSALRTALELAAMPAG